MKGMPREPGYHNHVPAPVVGPEVQGERSFSAGVGDVGGEEQKKQQGPGEGKAL